MPATPTARQTPSGIHLEDGHGTLVTFAADPDVSLWEKNVTPPGVDGGDAIEQTTMHNTTWRPMAPRQLKTLTEFEMTCAYDPGVITQLVSLINVETTVTVTFNDGTTWAFYGFLKSFEPEELSEGEQPTASCTVVPTNRDPTTGAESGPVIASVPGT